LQLPSIHSIRTKLFLLIGGIVILAVSAISGHNLHKFRKILEDQISEKTVSLADAAMQTFSNQIRLWQGQISQTLVELSNATTVLQTTYRDLVDINPDFVSFQHLRVNETGTQSIFFQLTSKIKNVNFEDKIPADIEKKLEAEALVWVKSLPPASVKDPIFLRNVSPAIGLPLFQIAIPAKTGANSLDWGILSIWQQPLIHILGQEVGTKSFIVDKNSNVLISTRTEDLFHPTNQTNDPMVEWAAKGKSEIGSRFYLSPEKEKRIGAFSHSKELLLTTVVTRDPQLAYDAIDKEIWSTVLLTILIILFVMLISYHSAGQITSNLKKLMEATEKISQGQLDARIHITSRDEVYTLGNSINEMAEQIQNLLVKKMEAARQEKELETAKIVQQTLFPKHDVSSSFFTATGTYFPASECGGDWWGHFTTKSGLEFICIADATGHGAGAALVTAIAFSSCMTLARTLPSAYEEHPEELLARFNEVLWQAGQGLTTMTFFASFFNKKTGVFSYSNSGHNFPLLIPVNPEDERLLRKKDGVQRYLQLQSRGTPLGLQPDSEYTKKTIVLEPSDKIFFYTDGLIECKDPSGEMWGKNNMFQLIEENALTPPENLKESAIKSAFSFFNNQPMDDDITIVVAQIDPTWVPTEAQHG